MKLLITGSAGFIGSHTAEYFVEKGYEVYGLDNFDPFYDQSIKKQNLFSLLAEPNFTFVEGDICDKNFIEDLFKSNHFDVVIHLAAKAGVRPSISDPDSYFHVNVDGTQNILEAISTHPTTKLIFASSSSVYGETNNVPFVETEVLSEPVSPYASTKIEGEKLCMHYGNDYGIHYTILRFFSVYGPRQRPDMGISKFFNQLINNLPVTLYGDGTSRRDYTFIEDIVKGIAASVELATSGEIINLGNSEPIKLRDLISTMISIVGSEANIEYQSKQEGDVFQTYANIQKAKELLNFDPGTKLNDGLVKQFEYLKVFNRV